MNVTFLRGERAEGKEEQNHSAVGISSLGEAQKWL